VFEFKTSFKKLIILKEQLNKKHVFDVRNDLIVANEKKNIFLHLNSMNSITSKRDENKKRILL
jgi:hypothetical protein